MTAYEERILALLGAHDPFEVLQATPLRLEQLFQTLVPADIESSYEPGGWGAREIIAHLADAEVAQAFRYRQTLAEANPGLQPWDQDAWALRYTRADPALAVAAFIAVRAWNLTLLSTLDLDDWLKEAYHPERGIMSVDQMVRLQAGHDLNHLAQLEAIAGLGS